MLKRKMTERLNNWKNDPLDTPPDSSVGSVKDDE